MIIVIEDLLAAAARIEARGPEVAARAVALHVLERTCAASPILAAMRQGMSFEEAAERWGERRREPKPFTTEHDKNRRVIHMASELRGWIGHVFPDGIVVVHLENGEQMRCAQRELRRADPPEAPAPSEVPVREVEEAAGLGPAGMDAFPTSPEPPLSVRLAQHDRDGYHRTCEPDRGGGFGGMGY